MTIPPAGLFGPSRKSAPPPAVGLAEDALARANAAIDRLAAEYPIHAERDIAEMERHLRMMARAPGDRRAHYNEILRIAHDMSGQGALFGFPLLTRYAASLCRATRLLEDDDRDILAIVRAHVTALRAVFDRRSRVDRRTALAIAAGLELLVSSRVGG